MAEPVYETDFGFVTQTPEGDGLISSNSYEITTRLLASRWVSPPDMTNVTEIGIYIRSAYVGSREILAGIYTSAPDDLSPLNKLGESSLTMSTAEDYAYYKLGDTNIALSPNTTYWIVLHSPSPGLNDEVTPGLQAASGSRLTYINGLGQTLPAAWGTSSGGFDGYSSVAYAVYGGGAPVKDDSYITMMIGQNF